jgi:hypothetical protein
MAKTEENRGLGGQPLPCSGVVVVVLFSQKA